MMSRILSKVRSKYQLYYFTKNSQQWKCLSTTPGKSQMFGKYLLVTNIVSSGVLMATGDLIQQHLEYINNKEHQDSYDWRRNCNMALIGVAQGPFVHYFYKLLDIFLPGATLQTVAKKICIDQTTASPFCIITFFLGMSHLSGDDWESSKQELADKFLTVYATDCCVWIPSQLLNFYLLPPQYRVLYINLVTMCYNVFLSFMKHKDEIR